MSEELQLQMFKRSRQTHLELQHQIHPLLAEGVDVVEDEGDDYVDAVTLVSGDTVLWKGRK